MKEYIEEEIPQPEKTEVTKEELASLIKECEAIRNGKQIAIPVYWAANHDYLLGQSLAWTYTAEILRNWSSLDISGKDLFKELKAMRDDRHLNYLFYLKRSEEPQKTLSRDHNVGLCDGYFSVVTLLSDFLHIDYSIINDEEEQGETPFTQEGE